jgi:(E)-4-hydroxy-3-methylbut-2-enyl-diphosphate synthase
MTDLGLTGGGRGTHQIYLDGQTSHRLKEGDESIIDHMVRMVEEKAAEIERKAPLSDLSAA